MQHRSLISVIPFVLALAGGALAQTAQHDHGSAAPAQAPAAAPPAARPMGGMGMHMQMHGGGMGMGMTGQAAPARGPLDRLDGRLAFLKAEVKPTAAQDKAWAEFEAALRESAKRGETARVGLAALKPESSYRDRLVAREQAMTAYAETLGLMRGGYDALLPQLDEAQKKTLDELLPRLFGRRRG